MSNQIGFQHHVYDAIVVRLSQEYVIFFLPVDSQRVLNPQYHEIAPVHMAGWTAVLHVYPDC